VHPDQYVAGMDQAVPFTEQCNPLSAALDAPSVPDRIRALARCDEQILAGVPDEAGLLHPDVLAACVRAAEATRAALTSAHGRVVLAGAGTSGRLALVLARLANERLLRTERRPAVRGWIAGGPAALLLPVEGAEDDLMGSRQQIDALLPGGNPNVVVGITCGLSAPCVAGGLAAALAQADTHAVLLGFNPVRLARPAFLPTAEAVAASPRGICITPVVGAEALAGSTRMKGGSATLLILDSVLEQAMAPRSAEPLADMKRRLQRIARVLAPFEDEAFVRDVALVADHAGRTLLTGRGIVYQGSGLFGVLGAIDASECPPTFGARPEQVRAFVKGGYGAVLDDPRQVAELEARAPLDLMAWQRREPRPADGTLVLSVLDGGGTLVGGRVGDRGGIRLVLGDAGDELAALLRLKLVLNAVSTCAFVTAGKVFGNRMVDLSLANSKLYRRAVRLVAELGRVPEGAAELAILGAIHDTETPGRDLLEAPVAQHVAVATTRSQVVPLALLTARSGVSLAKAKSLLAAQPLIREALQAAGVR
jgi:N-acetylmuramic acid 6-phosphate (MurNAc-6-P) etherase